MLGLLKFSAFHSPAQYPLPDFIPTVPPIPACTSNYCVSPPLGCALPLSCSRIHPHDLPSSTCKDAPPSLKLSLNIPSPRCLQDPPPLPPDPGSLRPPCGPCSALFVGCGGMPRLLSWSAPCLSSDLLAAFKQDPGSSNIQFTWGLVRKQKSRLCPRYPV